MKLHPICDLFPQMPEEEFRALVEDIRKHGIRVPIATWNGEIIDGRHRWRACCELKIAPPTKEWDGNGSLVEYVVGLNLRRRHLTPSQAACVAVDMLPMLEAEAKERQRAAGGDRKSAGSVPARIPEAIGGESREKAAALVGTNPRYVSDAKALRETHPEKFDAVRSGEITLPEAKQQIRQEKKQALAVELRAAPLPAPQGKFRVLVLDPPWKYEARAEDISHRARNPYPDMSVEEIAALPVSERAEEDAMVWLWTTNAFMREAFWLCDAWGFEVKTILTWAKDRMGTGDWLRGKTEHCLFAVRGRPIVTLTNQTTLLSAPMREHSRKPDEFYAMVEALCPGSKLEFFAREPRNGWQAWGAETQRFAS